MYVSYLQLDKEPAMYQNPVGRHPGLSLSPQNFAVPAPPQYSDFAGYHHHHHGIGGDPHPGQQPGPGGGGGWSPAYPPPPPARDDWATHHYGLPAAAAAAAAAGGAPAGAAMPGAVGPSLGFSPPEFPGQPALLPASLNASAGQLSPGSPQRRNPYDWIRRSSERPPNPSKTRSRFLIKPQTFSYFKQTCLKQEAK